MPILSGSLLLSEFIDRYGHLGDECRVWLGEEKLGFNCDTSCSSFMRTCGYSPEEDPGIAEECRAVCRGSPRAVSQCLADPDDCTSPVHCIRDY